MLRGLELKFDVEPANIDESRLDGENPESYVQRMARAKAERRARPGTLVLGADTIVVSEGSVLAKPVDPDDAMAMLARLTGREHEVLTAVAVIDGDSGRVQASVERSRVRIAPMSPSEIKWYVATGEPLDKAGAYAIQGLGALFVECIDGNYSNIVGLPIPTLYRLVAALGYSLLDFRVAV